MKRMVIFALLLSAGLVLTAGAPQVNVLSLQEGAFPLVIPAHYGGWNAEYLLDDSANSGWACEEGKTQNNVFVFELVGPTTLERFEFDSAAIDTEGSGAKDVLVEVSTTSAKEGFAPVLRAVLAAKADGQKFPAAKLVPAHWVRLTLQTNHGSKDYTELFSFRGFAPRPEQTTPKDVSGTYESTYSAFHLRQQGTALNGCYEYNDGLLTGVIEGRVMKLTWTEDQGRQRGPAVMVFAPDGKSFRGFWWREAEVRGAPSGTWDGTRKSPQVGGCPHWSGSVGGELKSKLASEGRARLYGILFDTDSAVIKAESKPVLDEVVKLLKSEAAWSLLIEGHTDATGGSAHNQTLSQQRAEAVKAYLSAGGIVAGRLTCAGFGQSKPVAGNDTELGRAQNRRVELVRK